MREVEIKKTPALFDPSNSIYCRREDFRKSRVGSGERDEVSILIKKKMLLYILSV